MSNPALYILMRNDMTSLTPGKAIAQGAHAANLFSVRMNNLSNNFENLNPLKKVIDNFRTWEQSHNQPFGTTIVLGCNLETLKLIVNDVQRYYSDYTNSDIVIDPTYPLNDGEVVHHIDIITCGYVFLDRDEINSHEIFKHAKLY